MTTNQTYKPSEGKREEFRKYLEKNGIMDALTKVLVNLYEEVEKPENALQYILDKLALQAGIETKDQLDAKINAANKRIEELENDLEQLKASAQSVEAGEGPQEMNEANVDESPADAPVEEPAIDEAPKEPTAASPPEEPTE